MRHTTVDPRNDSHFVIAHSLTRSLLSIDTRPSARGWHCRLAGGEATAGVFRNRYITSGPQAAYVPIYVRRRKCSFCYCRPQSPRSVIWAAESRPYDEAWKGKCYALLILPAMALSASSCAFTALMHNSPYSLMISSIFLPTSVFNLTNLST